MNDAFTVYHDQKEAKVSKFSSDLVEKSMQHKYFLQTLHSCGVSRQRQSTESLRRYCELWLPMVNEQPQKELIPPPDIAWLWHCHRLAPRDYERYVKEEFGCLLDANPPFAVQTNSDDCSERLLSPTHQLWNKTYPHESFFLEGNDECHNDEMQHARLLAGFDLLASTERQATFLWQVSGERFDDIEFLNEGVENYYKFLSLKPKAQGKESDYCSDLSN